MIKFKPPLNVQEHSGGDDISVASYVLEELIKRLSCLRVAMCTCMSSYIHYVKGYILTELSNERTVDLYL